MKKTFIVALLCAIASNVKAQNSTFPADGSNVGIGTLSPAQKLHIYGSGDLGQLIETSSGGASASTVYKSPSASWPIGLNLGFGSDVFTIGAKIFINSSGNVGIGNANPSSTFHLKMDNNFSMIQRTNNSCYAGHYYGTGPDNAIDFNFFTGLREYSDDYHLLNGYLAEDALVVKRTTNNIGIGTANPSGKLDIFNNNSNSTNLILSAEYSNSYRWRFNTVDRGNAIDMDITASNSGDQQESILKLSPTFSGRPSLILENNWLVANNGNIGINTTDNASWQLANSTYKLAVGGKILTEGVTVKLQSVWPDYVFNPTYNLRPLSEVKTYIDLNHHLPDMPSEKEVADKGLDVGEMNKLLTKKVEELTLYLIEKDKKEKDQQVEIQDLKKQVAAILSKLK